MADTTTASIPRQPVLTGSPLDSARSNKSASPEQNLQRQKYQANRGDGLLNRPVTVSATTSRKVSNSVEQTLNRIRASNQRQRQTSQADQKKSTAEKAGPKNSQPLDAPGMAVKMGSQKILTGLWASVWLDWTLLSLIGLNLYLLASLMTSRLAQFGDDYIFGKILPDKHFAKILEIMILAALDVIVGGILLMLFYFIYELAYAVTHPFATAWDLIWNGHWGLLWQAGIWLFGN